MAKVNAILDQIPESAAIYDASGRLERMNAAAQREPSQLFTPDPEGRTRANRQPGGGSGSARTVLTAGSGGRGSARIAHHTTVQR